MVAALGRPGPAEYYLDSQQTLHGPLDGAGGRREAAGQWWNPAGLFGLADCDSVEGAAFSNLYRGFSPDGGTALLRNAGGRRRRSGVDLVFPADKSVSALWAIADAATGRRIEEAHDDAVRLALLEIVAKHAMSGAHVRAGTWTEIHAADVMGATFRHGSSRARDPHLHTHCVIFNLARLRDGSRWFAASRDALYCWLRAAGAAYQHALAWNLCERIGVHCEPYGRNDGFVRVAGMPRGLTREWSKRRRVMENALELAGVRARSATGAQAAMIAKATRDDHDRHPDLEELRPVWARERKSWVPDPARLMASLSKPDELFPSPSRYEILRKLERVPDDLASWRSPFSHPDLVQRVCSVSAGYIDWRDASGWIAAAAGRSDVVRVDNPERSPAARAGQMHSRLYALEDTAESGDALREAARELSRDARFAVPQARVEERIRSLDAAGYPLSADDIAAIRHATSGCRIAVIELAPALDRSLALRPAADLHRDEGYRVIGAAATLRAAAELQNETGIASMQIDRLLNMNDKRALDDNRAWVFVIADAGILLARQLGTLFALAGRYSAKFVLVAEAGQRPLLAAAPGLDLVTGVTGCLRSGGRAGGDAVSEAFSKDLVRLGNGLGETLEGMVGDWDWHRSNFPRHSVAVVARTRKEERVLTHMLRTRLLGPAADGARACIRVHQHHGQMAYGKSVPMEIRTGDRLRLGATLWEARLFRGSVVTIEDIVPASSVTEEPRFLIRAATREGRQVEFFHDDVRDGHGGVRLAHGYACTVDELVGRFDRIFALADDGWRRGQIERVAACCRVRPRIHVNREQLAAALGAPTGDDALLDRLRQCWSLARGRDHPCGDQRLRPDRRAKAEDWLAANDGGDGTLRRLGQDIAQAALDLRHGDTVAAFAAGRAVVLEEWAAYRERIAVDGDAALLAPSVAGTLRRHRALLASLETLPREWKPPMQRMIAARGGLSPNDIREFAALYRRLRDQRRIAAARQPLQQPRKEAAGADTAPVEAWLAEVARQRRFRAFVLDVAERHAGHAREIPSWRNSLADARRLIARGREILAAGGVPQTGDAGRSAVQAAVAALEAERREDLSVPDRKLNPAPETTPRQGLAAALAQARQEPGDHRLARGRSMAF